jgi:hypothetical protein
MSHHHDHDHDHTELELALAAKVREQTDTIEILQTTLDTMVTLEHVLRLAVKALLPNVGDQVTIAVGKEAALINDTVDDAGVLVEKITFFRDDNGIDMRIGD